MSHLACGIRLLRASIFAIAIVVFISEAHPQSTAQEIYTIFQANCTSSGCHNNSDQSAGLDLQGSGPDSINAVLNSIINGVPGNTYASNAGYSYIAPGDPVRSFLFRKTNNGLDQTISMNPDEGEDMPLNSNSLSEVEVELIRQWILYGAPLAGEVVDRDLIESFYNDNGIYSVPFPPTPPPPGEGFQIHFGPLFIPPASEDEVFIKFKPDLEEETEITGLEFFIGGQSHHFIMNRYVEDFDSLCEYYEGEIPGPEEYREGYRPTTEDSHISTELVFATQSNQDVNFPAGTAFFWDSEVILDLNAHYINSNLNRVLSGEVYVNVETREVGYAVQELKAQYFSNFDIEIPNDGEEYTFTKKVPVGVCYNEGMYIWSCVGHTHQLGQDYDLYVNSPGPEPPIHLYDGSCLGDGEPGCPVEFFDYRHPAVRYFNEFYRLNPEDTLIHTASYINDGEDTVRFGLLSDDEMMVIFFTYLDDTSGLGDFLSPGRVIAVNDTLITPTGEAATINVLQNDIFVNGIPDTATFLIIGMPDHGSTTVLDNGIIYYLPDDSYTGIDFVEYVVCNTFEEPVCDTGLLFVYVMNPSAVIQGHLDEIKVSPNPTTGNFIIEDPFSVTSRFSLVSLNGNALADWEISDQETRIPVDLTGLGLTEGMYFLVIYSRDGSRGITRLVYRSAR